MLRALTIYQPWASLIIEGIKGIENRNRRPWKRLQGKLIGIHAGKRIDHDLESDYATRYNLPRPLPHGALLGLARIGDVVTESDNEWFVGDIGIVLTDVVAFPEPLRMGGAQSYWSALDRLTDAQRREWKQRMHMNCAHCDVIDEAKAWWTLCAVMRKANG